MKTIIHIGQHKTGTTSLQHYLQDQRQTLLTEGLYVPDALAGISHPSHYMLNVYALDEKRLSPMKEQLLANNNPIFFSELEEHLQNDIKQHYQLAKKAGCHTIIWSNEGLYLLNSVAEYRRLLSLFSDDSDEVLCICTFREKNAFRTSYIQQLKKQGIDHCDDIDSYAHVKHTSWLFDYQRKKQLLSQVFETRLYLDYTPKNMSKTFMQSIGFSSPQEECYLNITP